MYLSQATPRVAVRSTHPTLYPIHTLIPTLSRHSPHYHSFSIAVFLFFPASSLSPLLSPSGTHTVRPFHSLILSLIHLLAVSITISLPLLLFHVLPSITLSLFLFHLLTPSFTLTLSPFSITYSLRLSLLLSPSPSFTHSLIHSLSFPFSVFLFPSLFFFSSQSFSLSLSHSVSILVHQPLQTSSYYRVGTEDRKPRTHR